MLLVLAAVLRLVSEAFTIFGGELQRVTFSAEVLLNPCRYPAKFCHPLAAADISLDQATHPEVLAGSEKLLSCRQVARSSSAGIPR